MLITAAQQQHGWGYTGFTQLRVTDHIARVHAWLRLRVAELL